jgi:hypothetical protein
MKLNKVTAEMDSPELEQLIKEAIWLRMSLAVESISFDIGVQTVGYGQAERDERYFKGATITFAPGQNIGKAGD